jgi:hypothetical protein
MITAETLKTLTAMDPKSLTNLIRKAGYKEDRFTEVKFLGITNGGEFCYSCVYPGEFKDVCKVFVRVNTNGTLTAEY